MNTRLTALTTISAFALTAGIGAAPPHTTVPPVHNAVVHFGHQQPQPEASYEKHILDPNDVTIFKGGTVTFMMNGTGHAVAIYPVSKNTTRADISEDLCQGGPDVCNVANMTAAQPYTITDGDGNVVIAVAEFPTQRLVDSAPGQLFSAGGIPGILLTGSTPTTLGNQVKYRFAEDGRYLVICMNRVHALNDWMFGFVDVVKESKK
jgi:plastocyanin